MTSFSFIRSLCYSSTNWRHKVWKTVLLGLLLFLGIVTQAHAQGPPPELTDSSPASNAISVPLNSSVIFTYSTNIDSSSVTSRSVVVHSMMHGMVTSAPSTHDNVITVDPDDYFPGELVYAVATTQTVDITGTHPLTPTVWQFLAAAGAGPGTFPSTHIATSDAEAVQSVGAADLNGDGDVDLFSASLLDDKVAWYENDGGGAFTTHVVTTGANGASSVGAADLDADGDLDLFAACKHDHKTYWYENNGSGTFPITHAVTSYMPAWSPVSVGATDVDGDGDMDLLSASYSDDKISWYENDGEGTFTYHQVTNQADETYSVGTADLDGDGDMDLLSASRADDKIAWYENDGYGAFTTHVVTTQADEAISVGAADLDGDGDMDILSDSHLHNIIWYENGGSGTFPVSHTVTTALSGVKDVSAADVDGDGDMDILSASETDGRVAWYENGGSGAFFDMHTVTTAAGGAVAVGAADIDADGDLDLFSAATWDDKVEWYENDLLPAYVTLGKTVTPTHKAPYQGVVTYTLTISNSGGKDDPAVLLTDTLPVEVDFAGWIAQSGATEAGDEISWSGAINAGQAITISFAATNTVNTGAVITNTARFSATNQTGSAQAAYTAATPALVTLEKTATPSIEVPFRGLVTYTLVLSNSGGTDDPAVLLTDTLPAEVDFSRWIAQSGATEIGNTIGWNGKINSDQVVAISFAATNTMRSGTVVTNTARFSATAQSGSVSAVYTATNACVAFNGDWSVAFAGCPANARRVIPAGVTVTLDEDVQLQADLELQAGGTLETTSQRKTLTLTGGDGQTLNGNMTFYRLIVNKDNKTDKVTVNGSLAVTSNLHVFTGTLLSASDYEDIEIKTDGVLVLTKNTTVSGHFTNGGTLTTDGWDILFDGAKTQYLVLDTVTSFNDVVVYTNTVLVETNPSDNVILNGNLTNYGTIRKTQPVSVTGDYSFGLAGFYPDYSSHGLEIAVIDRIGGDPLTAIRVDRIDHAHPQAPLRSAGLYWIFTPAGSDFVANVTLPYQNVTQPLACRYTGSAWDCANDDSGTNYVSYYGTTVFSDWTVCSARQMGGIQYLPLIYKAE